MMYFKRYILHIAKLESLMIFFRCFFLIFFLLQQQNALAQLVASAVSTPSSCSANGKITLTVSGGQAPYILEIVSAPLGVSRPPQNNLVFDLLPAGNYQIEVKDNAGSNKVVNVTISGNYKEPTLVSCSIPQYTSTATLIAKDGLLPYKYSNSSDGGISWSAPQNSNIFNCLPNGNHVFRVIDACDNFYPCYNSVTVYEPYFNHVCNPNTSGGTDIVATRYSIEYGELPITYVASNASGQNFTNTTGIFIGLPGCNFSVKATDKCGRVYEVNNINCGVATLTLGVNCVNFNVGTATIKATGGNPPYIYKEVSSGKSNATGSFTGLPIDQQLYFEVEDACGNIRYINVSPPSINIWHSACPYDGEIKLSQYYVNRSDSDSCVGGCTYNFFPMTFQCLDCVPAQTKVVNNPSRFDSFGEVVLAGAKSGIYKLRISDQCGNVQNFDYPADTSEIRPYIDGDYCNTGKIQVKTYESANSTFNFYIQPSNTLVASNTTGIFSPILNQNYNIEITKNQCKTIVFPFTATSFLSANYSCDSVGLTPCPNVAGYTYRLYNMAGSLLQTSTQPFFKNLQHGTEYKVIAKNSLWPGDSIETSFITYEIAPIYEPINITCSSFDIVQNPYWHNWYDHHQIPLKYELYNSSSVLIETTENSFFDTLVAGLYTYKVKHPYCGERQGTVTIPSPIKANACLGAATYTSSFNNYVPEFGWYLDYGPTSLKIKIKGGPYNMNEEFVSMNPNHQIFLPPGKYYIESECGKDTLILSQPNFQLEVDVSGDCPGFGKFEPGGWPTDDEWKDYLNPLGFNYCPYYSGDYQIYDKDWNYTPYFNNLPSGETYYIVMTTNGVHVDTMQVTSPFYSRPDLSSTFGVVCTSDPKGDVQLTVQGGTKPYTYEMLSPPTGYIISSDDTTVQFVDLDAGSYIFRVYDACGISSDYSASVDVLNFTPQFKRFCDGKIQLIAPQISNATYTWKNSSGTVVGNIYNPIVNDVGAMNYTVNINTGACTYSKTFSVPAQTLSDVSANAGVDFTVYSNIAQLNASATPNWTQNSWTQIFPSSGSTSFNDFSNSTTDIDVSVFPGLYTYLWTVDGGVNGCVDYDTMTVTFLDCDPANNFSINISKVNSSCSVANGSANVKVTPTVGNYTYLWSTGESTAMISNLSLGTYYVTVSDDDICTPDVKDSVIIVGKNQPTSSQTIGVCNGQSYTLLDGTQVNAAGVYPITIQTSSGCDSTITTTLTLLPNYDIQLTSTSCNPSNTGVFVQNLISSLGCDSIVTTTVSLISSYDIQLTSTSCNPSDTGVFVQKLISSLGCDSTVTTTVSLIPSYDIQLTSTSCNPLDTGVFVQNLISSLGCDSIVTTTVSLISSYDIQLTSTSCNPSDTGVFVQILISSLGCDSIVTTTVSLISSYDIQLTSTSCNPSDIGIFVQNLISSSGCDSTVTKTVTLLPPYDIRVTSTSCNPLDTGVFVQNLISTLGCDSIITKTITLVNNYNIQLVFSSCNPLDTGVFVQNLISSSGCDSTITTTVSLIYSYDIQLTSTSCNPLDTGVFVQNLISTLGCDSIVTTTVSLISSYDIQLTSTSCNPLDTGVFVQNLISTLGCDSIITSTVSLLPKSETQLQDTICEGEVYVFDGNLIDKGGVYSSFHSNTFGCDSVVHLTLIQSKIPEVFLGIDTFICDKSIRLFIDEVVKGDYKWQDGSNGSFYDVSEPGIYWILAKNLCGEYSDSIFVEKKCPCNLFLPNAFSPNGDNANDIFKPIFEDCELEDIELIIYDRWGKLVYQSKELIGWDGKTSEGDAPMDTYIWLVNYKDKNTKDSKKGIVTLVR